MIVLQHVKAGQMETLGTRLKGACNMLHGSRPNGNELSRLKGAWSQSSRQLPYWAPCLSRPPQFYKFFLEIKDFPKACDNSNGQIFKFTWVLEGQLPRWDDRNQALLCLTWLYLISLSLWPVVMSCNMLQAPLGLLKVFLSFGLVLWLFVIGCMQLVTWCFGFCWDRSNARSRETFHQRRPTCNWSAAAVLNAEVEWNID